MGRRSRSRRSERYTTRALPTRRPLLRRLRDLTVHHNYHRRRELPLSIRPEVISTPTTRFTRRNLLHSYNVNNNVLHGRTIPRPAVPLGHVPIRPPLPPTECQRRSTRREIMFANGSGGARNNRPPVFTRRSKVKC